MSGSPDRAPITRACAASSTELSGTPSSAPRWRSTAVMSPGTVASWLATPGAVPIPASIPTPGAVPRVQRGMAVNPPASSTPRQYWRAASAVSDGLMVVVTSHLPRRVSAPPGAGRNLLALHEEGVGGEHRAVAHGHAVVDQCADPDRAAGAEHDPVGLERAVLLRVALDLAARVERAAVPDGDERPFRQEAAVIVDPPADLHSQAAPDQVLERRAVEYVQVGHFRHLPQAFVPPEVRVVDGAVSRLQPAKTQQAAFQQHEVDRGDQDAGRQPRGHLQLREPAVGIERSQEEHRVQEDVQPPG